MLKQLELGPRQLDALQALPIARLTEAIGPAQKTLPPARYALLDRYNFGPAIDGQVLPAHPFDPAATALSDDIPVMMGGTKDELAIFLAPDDAVWNRTLSEEELRKRIAAVAGDATDSLVAYYKRRDAAATPVRSSDHRAYCGELPGALDGAGRAQGRSAARPPSGCTGSTGRRRRSAAG